MKSSKRATVLPVLLGVMTLGGCANSPDGVLSTASVAPAGTSKVETASPICVALANKIQSLKSDGTVSRLEQAASGKTTTVRVKRDAIARQAELNGAYAEYQTACGPKLPTVANNNAIVAPVVAQAARTGAAAQATSAGKTATTAAANAVTAKATSTAAKAVTTASATTDN